MAPGVSAIQPATVGMMGSWTPLARRDEVVDLPMSNAVLPFLYVDDLPLELHRLQVPDNEGGAVGRLARLDADRAADGRLPDAALLGGFVDVPVKREKRLAMFKELERGRGSHRSPSPADVEPQARRRAREGGKAPPGSWGDSWRTPANRESPSSHRGGRGSRRRTAGGR